MKNPFARKPQPDSGQSRFIATVTARGETTAAAQERLERFLKSHLRRVPNAVPLPIHSGFAGPEPMAWVSPVIYEISGPTEAAREAAFHQNARQIQARENGEITISLG